jgi:hypothetical protein
MFAMSLSQTKLTKQALGSSILRGVIGNAPVIRPLAPRTLELQGTWAHVYLANACATHMILVRSRQLRNFTITASLRPLLSDEKYAG